MLVSIVLRHWNDKTEEWLSYQFDCRDFYVTVSNDGTHLWQFSAKDDEVSLLFENEET